MSNCKTFGAFVRELARARVDQAQALASYVERPSDGLPRVRLAIKRSVSKGLITAERADSLNAAADVCFEWYKTHGRVVEHADPEDWVSLGNGARMRRTHLGSDGMGGSRMPSFASMMG